MMSPDFLQNIRRVIDLLLRYITPGASTILSFGIMQSERFSFLKLAPSTEVSPWLLGLFIAVIGPSIYSIHRAFLHRILQHVGFKIFSCRQNAYFRRFSDLDSALSELDKCRTKWRIAQDSRLGMYEEWSAQIHFLYCTSWGMLAAMAVHTIGQGFQRILYPYQMISISLLILITAIIGDLRALKHQLSAN